VVMLKSLVQMLRQSARQWRKSRKLSDGLRRVSRFDRASSALHHGLPKQLIVSLTSYPARFDKLHLTLRGLLLQRMKPDALILWIDEQDYAKLPENVKELEGYGLQIKFTPDLGSFTKLVPALKSYPEAYIVTADDDCYYDENWLSKLVEGVNPERPQIIAHRAHLAKLDVEGVLIPYGQWDLTTSASRAEAGNVRLFPTGVGGVIYPPNSLAPDVVDEEKFMRLCPKADDVWFFWMARLRGTEQVRLPGRFETITWPETQESGLWKSNFEEAGNDPQIKAMEREFGLIP
jgi:hypothetical protein